VKREEENDEEGGKVERALARAIPRRLSLLVRLRAPLLFSPSSHLAMSSSTRCSPDASRPSRTSRAASRALAMEEDAGGPIGAPRGGSGASGGMGAASSSLGGELAWLGVSSPLAGASSTAAGTGAGASAGVGAGAAGAGTGAPALLFSASPPSSLAAAAARRGTGTRSEK